MPGKAVETPSRKDIRRREVCILNCQWGETAKGGLRQRQVKANEKETFIQSRSRHFIRSSVSQYLLTLYSHTLPTFNQSLSITNNQMPPQRRSSSSFSKNPHLASLNTTPTVTKRKRSPRLKHVRKGVSHKPRFVCSVLFKLKAAAHILVQRRWRKVDSTDLGSYRKYPVLWLRMYGSCFCLTLMCKWYC